MTKFTKYIFLFSIPFISVITIYIVTDVFKIIYSYNPFYEPSCYVGLNRAYGSLVTYNNQNPKYHYDSFILGNSRSLFYEIDVWKKYLPNGSKCMHFDANGGTIGGLHAKIAYIDRTGGNLKNALLILDYGILSNFERKEGYLYITPPMLKEDANLSDYINFHYQHFIAFINPVFVAAIADYNISHTFRPYMQTLIIDDKSTYNPEYNEFQWNKIEMEIKNGSYYDNAHISVFNGEQKPGSYSKEHLGKKEIRSLSDIKKIFDKHHTNYKIVISPLYDQIKLNRNSYNIICKIFGKQNVFDFSGINKWNKDYHNYYETSHYRPIVSNEIMDIIYNQ